MYYRKTFIHASPKTLFFFLQRLGHECWLVFYIGVGFSAKMHPQSCRVPYAPNLTDTCGQLAHKWPEVVRDIS